MIERDILSEWNRQKVRYCILRSYEHLIKGSRRPKDLDIAVHEEDIKKAEKALFRCGFVKKRSHFDRSHQGYAFIGQDFHKTGFDIQRGGVHWNNISYLDDSIFKNRKKKSFFYTLSDDDAYIMYLCHSILGKKGKFKEEYKEKISKLSPSEEAFRILSSIFSHSAALWIMKKVSIGKYDEIEKNAVKLIALFLVKKARFLKMVPTFLRWIWQKKILPYPVLACIGPDGSGKTTAVCGIEKALNKDGKKSEVVYFGRGKKNILPVKKAGRIFMEKKKSAGKFLKKIVFTASVPVYSLDLVIRYWTSIFWKRRKRIIITDRYFTDILMIPNAPEALKKTFFLLFPKPTAAIYLYAEKKTLFNRKKQQTPQELERQMRQFSYATKKLKALEIRTDSEPPDEVVRKGLMEILRKGNY